MTLKPIKYNILMKFHNVHFSKLTALRPLGLNYQRQMQPTAH